MAQAPDDDGGRLDAAHDEALARRARLGDRDALELLVRRYLRSVHAVAASFLAEQSQVEDAAQETFLRAIRALESWNPERPFAPWLYQIARNTARNHLASHAARRAEPLTPLLRSTGPGPHDLVERSELRARVRESVARLPEQQRTAFWLCDVEGYAAVEAARIMDLAAGTVRSHVHHARVALRAALAATRETG